MHLFKQICPAMSKQTEIPPTAATSTSHYTKLFLINHWCSFFLRSHHWIIIIQSQPRYLILAAQRDYTGSIPCHLGTPLREGGFLKGIELAALPLNPTAQGS